MEGGGRVSAICGKILGKCGHWKMEKFRIVNDLELYDFERDWQHNQKINLLLKLENAEILIQLKSPK